MEVPCVKIQQRDVELLVTALPLSELRKHAKVDYYSPDNPGGYQRPLVDRRLSEIGKFMTQDEGTLPMSILVCAREGDPNAPFFTAEDKVGAFGQSGVVSIPDDAVLWVVDGQHRHFGVERAYQRGATELADYPFPVTIMMGVPRYTEMRHFLTINTEQKKMQTDIVDRHLVQMREHEGLNLIAKGPKGEREYLRAQCTSIVDKLNEKPGPWRHQISIPGVPGREKGLVRQHAMVASLQSALTGAPWLKDRPEDDVAKLLTRYWRAMASVWEEAFADPSNYRVQATVGVYSLHMAFPALMQYCTAMRDFSEDLMEEAWAQTGIISKFWHKEDGDPYTIGTGMGSIRALAAYLRGLLPQAPIDLGDPS